MPENPHRGSSFEDFLKEEGILEVSTAAAVKKVLAWQIEQAMQTQHFISGIYDKKQQNTYYFGPRSKQCHSERSEESG